MSYFSRVTKHYIRLALEASGIKISGDVRTELNDAFDDLEASLCRINSLETDIQQLREEMNTELARLAAEANDPQTLQYMAERATQLAEE